MGAGAVVGDLGHAFDPHPVFVALMVHLQGQFGAGFNHDALDLEARAFLERGAGAPGATDRTMQAIGFVGFVLELLGDAPYIMRG